MNRNSEHTIFRNILAAFLILIMHVLLVAGIGVLILFFYGIINHIGWVLLGVSCLSAGGYWFIKRLRSDVRDLRSIAGDSFKGKTVEVSLLGGIASFRVSDTRGGKSSSIEAAHRPLQLVSSDRDNMKTLTELAGLYEKKLITLDEYNRAKQKLLK